MTDHSQKRDVASRKNVVGDGAVGPGSRATLCLTFDNMGSAADVGQRRRLRQDPADASIDEGLTRLLALLDGLGLRATFFLEGWNALHNPEAVALVAAKGHEIGLHGWVHEVFHNLDEFDAERVLVDSLAAFSRLGIAPRGFRAPGGLRGDHTPSILRRLGLEYDSSVDAVDEALEPYDLNGGIVCIPWQWKHIDYYHYFMAPGPDHSPSSLADLLDSSLTDAVERAGVMTVIFHAHVSAVDEARFDVMRRFLTRAKHHPDIDVLSAGQVAVRHRDASCGTVRQSPAERRAELA